MTKDIYRQRVQRVLEYIYAHLDESLSFETLAEVACLSPYHYHRIYRSILGETVTQSIKRLRFQRAAQDLIQTQKSLTAIARKAHFTNTDSFTRAFHESYGLPPQSYRDRGQELTLKIMQPQKGDSTMYHVDLITLSPFSLITLHHVGDYMEMGSVFEKLFSLTQAQNLVSDQSHIWGMYYDDPQTVPKDQLRGKAGVSLLDPKAVLKEGLERTDIEGGLYAKVLYKGPYTELNIPYTWIFNTWLLDSGYEPKDAPVIEEYLNTPHDTAPKDLLTAIHIPLKG
jgi:AraC family transcriptional regulator